MRRCPSTTSRSTPSTVTSADLHDYQDKTVLLVNVASKCGLTPQYTGLERIHEKYKDRGFTVLGVPCNQFGGTGARYVPTRSRSSVPPRTGSRSR